MDQTPMKALVKGRRSWNPESGLGNRLTRRFQVAWRRGMSWWIAVKFRELSEVWRKKYISPPNFGGKWLVPSRMATPIHFIRI